MTKAIEQIITIVMAGEVEGGAEVETMETVGTIRGTRMSGEAATKIIMGAAISLILSISPPSPAMTATKVIPPTMIPITNHSHNHKTTLMHRSHR